MTCEARAPETGEPCRIEGVHALHIAGYGSSMTQWEAEDFVDPRPRSVDAETLNGIAQAVEEEREVQSVDAVAHRDDPWTSHHAAAVVGDMKPRMEFVLELFRVYGDMTDDQLHAHICVYLDDPKVPWASYRTPRGKLVEQGFLEARFGGRRVGLSENGNPATIWGLLS